MTAPNFLPVLSKGAHASPRDGACVMEYVSLLAGERWSDNPSCTHPVLAAAARHVNDGLPDGERQQLVPLIGRLFGTAPTGTDHEQKVLSVRLAVWCARQVQHLVRPTLQVVCRAAVASAEAWCDGRATPNESYEASFSAYAASAASSAASFASVYAASSAYAASSSAYAASSSAYAASSFTAAYAAAAAYAPDVLTGLLDEYDRLTGRTTVALSDEQYATLAQAAR